MDDPPTKQQVMGSSNQDWAMKCRTSTPLMVVGTTTSPALALGLPLPSSLESLLGPTVIGNVCYSTIGATASPTNVQPFIAGYHFSSVALAHNGNLVNVAALRSTLESQGPIFKSSDDTEVVLHLLAHYSSRPRPIKNREAVKGAFSFLDQERLRDGFGI